MVERHHRKNPRSPHRRRSLVASTVAVLAVAAAACGNGDDDATDATSPANTSQAPTGSAPGSAAPGGDGPGSTAAAPTGEPVKLGSLLTIRHPAWSNANVELVNDAWEDYVNEELGGINGRPLEVHSCDDEGDPGKGLQCVQDLIDEGIVAFVNNSSLVAGASAVPALEAEGIPNIGGWPVAPVEFNTEVNFLTTPGTSGSYPSLAAYLASQGAESVAFLYSDTPGGLTISDQMEALWAELTGGEFTGVSFDPTATDFVPTMTRVKDANPDAVIFGVGEGPAGRMFQAAAVVGIDAMMAATSAAATQVVFDSAGDAIEGVVFSVPTLPPTLTGNDEVDRYVDVMARFAPDVELTPQSGAAASSIQYAVDVLSSIDGEITTASVLAALQDPPAKPFLAHSISPDLAPASLPRLWNPYNIIVQYVDGDLVLVGDNAPESDHVDKEGGVTWFTGFVPDGAA